jgi:PAS domain S-box-containing protein
MIAGPHLGNYDAGFRFGQLGYELVERRGLKRFQARTYMCFASHVMPWTKHVRACRDLIHRTFETANKIGDLCFAAYSHNNVITNLLAAGDPLVEVLREAENALEFAQKVRFGLVIDIITAQLGLIRTLLGSTPKFGSFSDVQFDELRFERHLASDPAALPECFYWIRKLQARFFSADYVSALDASLKAQPLLWTAPSNLEMAEYHFYGALSHAASWDSAFPDHKQQHVEALATHYAQLEIWAKHCPENYENRAALVGAEIARLEGRNFEAMRFYEQAIRSAYANGFVHNEALAYELAGRFYAARGFDEIADAYLRGARYCYLRWGADAKVRQLDQLYPQLREKEPLPGPSSTIVAPVEQLDLATVIKISQTVSSEIVLETLIDTLMRTAIEHAGAERGLLVLPQGIEHRVEAEATISGDAVVVRRGEAAVRALPESMVRYVVRTHECVILADAAANNPFSADTYIRERHARSILCLPLMNQARLIGVLYLENNLTSHVFTPTRIAVLKLLASQAAISLENTRLYADLEKREAKIRRLVDANIMGVYIWSLEGKVVEANTAFLNMIEHDREDLVSGRMRWTDLTPGEWRARDARALTDLKEVGTAQPYEKEFFSKHSGRVPVLVGSALFENGGDEGVAFVLDLSERKQGENALRSTQAELARFARLTTMAALSASIAHEVTQPLAAIITNGEACLRLLAPETLNLNETRQALASIIRDGNRAVDVVARVRALLKKSDVEKTPVDLEQLIREVLVLVQPEMAMHRIVLRTALSDDLPPVLGDRIQLQQVLLNLMTNSIEAMRDVADRSREVTVSAHRRELGVGAGVMVTVKDTGVGFEQANVERLFEALYTTKPDGLGMGLSISRSIVETYQGRLWCTPNAEHGATFQFVLPACGGPTP